MTTYTDDISIDLTDLYNITGSNEDVHDLFRISQHAVSIIETITGVFFESEFREVPVSVTDAAWLKRAALYQTQFMVDHEVFSAQSVSSISQDGLSISAPDELTFILGPLAKRALSNCSWAKSGTLKVSAADKVEVADFLVNDNHAWAPIGTIR